MILTNSILLNRFSIISVFAFLACLLPLVLFLFVFQILSTFDFDLHVPNRI